MSKLIEPRTLRGFRDYAPALMIPRERVLETARRVYRCYGFAPIDTPAMEYAEVLLGKGGGENDKIVYRFKDHGDRDVALRFDLTVPFARFAAQTVPQLGVPFKRYAMGPVWRGENTGHGRYREFWQCDFDTIGTTANASDIEVALVINDLFTALGFEQFEIRVNNRLVLNGLLESLGILGKSVFVLRAIDKLDKLGRDATLNELVLLSAEQATLVWSTIWPLLCATLKECGGDSTRLGKPIQPQSLRQDLIGRFGKMVADVLTGIVPFSRYALVQGYTQIWVNDVLEEYVETSFSTPSGPKLWKCDIAGIEDSEISRALEASYRERFIGIDSQTATAVLNLVGSVQNGELLLDDINSRFGNSPKVAEGVCKLRELLAVAKAAGVPDGRIRIDLSIARGLDYYTGTIYETFLLGDYTDDKGKPAKLSGFGSVCSGGRYDNLASLYTKQVLPGVGASLGVDRLLAAMEAMKHPWLAGRSTPADVLVVQMDATRLADYMRIATVLRNAGIPTEVYPDATKKLKAQFEYADKRGFRYAVIAGGEEFAAGVWKVKDLAKREERTLPEAELAGSLRSEV